MTIYITTYNFLTIYETCSVVKDMLIFYNFIVFVLIFAKVKGMSNSQILLQSITNYFHLRMSYFLLVIIILNNQVF